MRRQSDRGEESGKPTLSNPAPSTADYAQRVEHLPSFLTRLLQERGLSQRQAAKLLGVSHSTVGNAISGRYAPYWKQAEPWANALALEGEVRERFLDAMAVAASPARVVEIIARLEAQRSSS